MHDYHRFVTTETSKRRLFVADSRGLRNQIANCRTALVGIGNVPKRVLDGLLGLWVVDLNVSASRLLVLLTGHLPVVKFVFQFRCKNGYTTALRTFFYIFYIFVRK